MKVFIFGAGYSARAFAASAPESDVDIAGTTRSREKFGALERIDVTPMLFDGRSIGPEIGAALAETTHLVMSIAPDERGDPVLNRAGPLIAENMPRLRWIGYLSTVGVYGDHGGEWVDEASECRPISSRSVMRVRAENAWLARATEIGVPLAILRLSSIYGPGRNAFVNRANGTAKRLVKPGQVFNRIFVADIAGALWHLGRNEQNGIFNVTDDLPAPPQDVVAYAAKLMGVSPPPEIPFESAQLSPMARSFYGENKRVSNKRLKQAGYAFRFADYRIALASMWREQNWQGEGSGDARSAMKDG